jgi:hypothetical protein
MISQQDSPSIEITELKSEYPHYPEFYNEGGYKLEIEADSNFLSNTKALLVDLGSKLMKGSLDLNDINLPAAMMIPMSRLEFIANDYSCIGKYLTAASKQKEPLEVMKLVAAGEIAQLSVLALVGKGCPPIQCFKGDRLEATDPFGNQIFLQHESLVQDVSSVLFKGKDGAFEVKTEWNNKVSTRGMSLTNIGGGKIFPTTIKLANGITLTVKAFEFELDGSMSQTKYLRYKGTMKIEDAANNIVCLIKILENPKKGMFGGMFGSKKEVDPMDFNKFEVDIIQEKKVLCKGGGNYSSHLELDRKVYWRCTDPRYFWTVNAESMTENMRTLKLLIATKKFQEADALLKEMRETQAKDFNKK